MFPSLQVLLNLHMFPGFQVFTSFHPFSDTAFKVLTNLLVCLSSEMFIGCQCHCFTSVSWALLDPWFTGGLQFTGVSQFTLFPILLVSMLHVFIFPSFQSHLLPSFFGLKYPQFSRFFLFTGVHWVLLFLFVFFITSVFSLFSGSVVSLFFCFFLLSGVFLGLSEKSIGLLKNLCLLIAFQRLLFFLQVSVQNL